jgi:hypothetical protein
MFWEGQLLSYWRRLRYLQDETDCHTFGPSYESSTLPIGIFDRERGALSRNPCLEALARAVRSHGHSCDRSPRRL